MDSSHLTSTLKLEKTNTLESDGTYSAAIVPLRASSIRVETSALRSR